MMPDHEWKNTLDLLTDVATIMDCQRYNQFDGMNLHPVSFVAVLEQSLRWREVFSLPQVPPSTVAGLREAFAQVEWPADTDDLRFSVKKLLAELEDLLFFSKDADLKSVPKDAARRRSRSPTVFDSGCNRSWRSVVPATRNTRCARSRCISVSTTPRSRSCYAVSES